VKDALNLNRDNVKGGGGRGFEVALPKLPKHGQGFAPRPKTRYFVIGQKSFGQ